MAEISKTQLLETSKEIVKRAVPYLVIVPFLVLLHFILIAIWAYFYRDLSTTAYTVVIVIGILLPLFAYLPWGIKRFIAGAYMGVHNNIIQPQLHPFCKKTAGLLLNHTFNNTAIPDHAKLLVAWKTNVDNFLNSMPSIIQFVARRVTRKLSFASTIVDRLNLIGNKDLDGVANLLNQEIALALINTSKNLVPRWVTYIIPITSLYYLFIWFL